MRSPTYCHSREGAVSSGRCRALLETIQSISCYLSVVDHRRCYGRQKPQNSPAIRGETIICTMRPVDYRRLLGAAARDGFKRVLDSYCGLCIIVVYFLYLNVVKGALSVFDCSLNKDGQYILDADPSIKCNEVR